LIQANSDTLGNTEVKNKVTIITAVAKKKAVDAESTKKGELMESNMDAMEVTYQLFFFTFVIWVLQERSRR